MSTRLEKWINGVSMTMLALFAGVFALQTWILIKDKFEAPPVRWYGVEVKTPIVAPGGTLELIYDAEVSRQCPAELRSFIREADGSVVGRWVAPGGYTAATPGRKKIPVRLKIEDDPNNQFPPLRDGKHTYEVTAIRFCDDGLRVDNLIPKATFEIRR